MAVLCFFGWLGLCAVVAWLTAFQMPDGFGNAIFGLQIIGGVVSSSFMAMGLPTAIDPSTKVVVTGRGGQNYETTWERAKGVKFAAAGLIIFLVFNIGGWILDVQMGLPERHLWKLKYNAEHWAGEKHPELDACLATVWTAELVRCKARYRVTTPGGVAHLELRSATCDNATLEPCVRRGLATCDLPIDARQRDSLEFAGPVTLEISLPYLRGTGPPPPAERAP